MIRFRDHYQRTAVVLLVPLLITAYYLLSSPSKSLMQNDSWGYITFSADRPIGYPIFLRLVEIVLGDHSLIRPIQLGIFCLCSALLGLIVLRYSKSLIAALVAEIGILGYPGPIGLADSILSDSLSASAILLYGAALYAYISAPSFKRYCIVCTIVATAIMVRPINVALLPGTFFAALLCKQQVDSHFRRSVIAFATSALLGWYSTPLIYKIVLGKTQTTTPLARGIFQKVIFLPPRPERSIPMECEAPYIDSITSPINRYLQTVPREFQDVMKFKYSQIIRFSIVIPELEQLYAEFSERNSNEILMCYTIDRIKEHPQLTLLETANEYWNMVTNYTFVDHRWRERYLDFVHNNPPALPHIRKDELTATLASFEDPPMGRPMVAIVALKSVQIFLTGVSLIGILLLLTRKIRYERHNEWLLIGLIGLAIQSYLIIVSIVEIAEARYMFGIWSLLWITLVIFALRATRVVKDRKASALTTR